MVIEARRDQYQLVVQVSDRVEAIERRVDTVRRSDERRECLHDVSGVPAHRREHEPKMSHPITER